MPERPKVTWCVTRIGITFDPGTVLWNSFLLQIRHQNIDSYSGDLNP